VTSPDLQRTNGTTRLSRLIAVVAALALSAGAVQARDGAGQIRDGAAARLAEYRSSPPLLRAFLYRMPKGGDLHNHLSGAAYAEATIRAGAAAGVCVNPETRQIAHPPCAAPARPIADAEHDAALNRTLVEAWSMRDFVPTSGYSGHDHFFDAFGKFGGAAPMGDMAAEVVDRAARQRMRYVELMVTFQGSAVGTLADKVAETQPLTDDPAPFEAALRQAGIEALVAHASKDIDTIEQRMRDIMHCNTPQAKPGCSVTVRWLQQVSRVMPPQRVFASSLFGALLEKGEPRVVGLDFVAPEDDPNALADYSLQMHMLDYLHGQMPETNISLHAGELTMGLVRPEDLLFHIRQAVELGHAKRIGHGVDVMYEEDPFGLLHEMAQKRVAVEINLTSNAVILGVQGADHPFPIYRSAGVPTVLSTDDEGIERIDRTHELQRAVTTYGLDWQALVGLERNTLEYAFLAGDSLWADSRTWRKVAVCSGSVVTHDPLPVCATFLYGNDKARLQWDLERDLANFDREAQAMKLSR
jgi:adenosine deaminase